MRGRDDRLVARMGETALTLDMDDQAVATSGGYGLRFDVAGRFNHLFDPRTGRSPTRYGSGSVVMPTATEADALSTAFNLMPVEAVERVMAELGPGRAFLLTAEGTAPVGAA